MRKIQSLHLISSLLIVLLCTACNSNKNGTTDNTKLPVSDHDFIQLLLSFDTLAKPQRLHLTDSLLHTFTNIDKKDENPYYNFMMGYNMILKNIKDSPLVYFEKMQVSKEQLELGMLKELQIFRQKTSGMSEVSFVKDVLDVTNKAEAQKSVFVNGFYDLLAQCYYQNLNVQKAKKYTDLYYNHHPFKHTSIIKQRYHDISFLLSTRLKDTTAMRQHLDSSRLLAIKINDSIALMRSFENEAQLLSYTGRNDAAVKLNQLYFKYQERNGQLRTSVFNNLALNFYRNNQIDSAIVYYKKGIEWKPKNEPTADLTFLYDGLRIAYNKIGDYKNAYIMLDSTFTTVQNNTQKIQAEKIEEIHTRYETEKKDQAIAALKNTNTLHEKIIAQQRWIFIVAGLLLLAFLLFVYTTYRRKLLAAKNEQLQIENKRLLLEQKARQMQLNPHFIYNAIANLQGLISSDKKQEANAYLIAFSKLIRNILELNRQEFISLDDEIASLKNYLELQQMRYENTFSYQIETDDLDTEAVLIPPMLVQPFVENAIEHGFKNIHYKGQLDIHFKKENNQLQIFIVDNGAGNSSKTATPTEKKSLSRIITQERLDILFNQKEKQAYFETPLMSDKAGYCVKVFIPLLTA